MEGSHSTANPHGSATLSSHMKMTRSSDYNPKIPSYAGVDVSFSPGDMTAHYDTNMSLKKSFTDYLIQRYSSIVIGWTALTEHQV